MFILTKLNGKPKEMIGIGVSVYNYPVCTFRACAILLIVRSATERAIVTVHSSIQGKSRSATSSWTSINIFCPLDEDARIHRRIEHTEKIEQLSLAARLPKKSHHQVKGLLATDLGVRGMNAVSAYLSRSSRYQKKKTCKTNAMDSRRGPFPYVSRQRITCMVIPASIRKATEVLSRKTETSMLLCNDASNMASPDYYNCNEHPIPFFVKSLHDKIRQSLSESIPNFLYT